MIACAAHAGGDAAKDCFRFLERQLQPDCNAPESALQVSETPLCQADFDQAVKRHS